MKKIVIDQEEFIKLYNDGVTFRKLAHRYKCSVSKIQLMRIQLGLQEREVRNKTFNFNTDFRQPFMFHQKNPPFFIKT